MDGGGEKRPEKQDLSAVLVPWGGSSVSVPSVSGYMLCEGRQLIKFSRPELDQLRQRRTRDSLTAATRQKVVQCSFKAIFF